jgi:integrase/recombinase XerC/integrase/recombinase XerD
MSGKVLAIVATNNALSTYSREDLIKQAGEWFGFDIANGDARQDTIDTYMSGLKHWLTWCRISNVDPGTANKEHVKMFRKELVDCGSSAATINSKLTSIRRFYESALQRGYIALNPAVTVRAPKDRSAASEIVSHLSDIEANRVFQAIPNDDRLKSIRDRAIIALMTIEGLRRIEIHRANDEDIELNAGKVRMLIHGKGKDRVIYPRSNDVAKVINKYMDKRGTVKPDATGLHPLFVEVTKAGNPQGRLTRRGITKMVSTYFLKAGITATLKDAVQKRQRNCHSLRHTCGTDIYRETGDLKLVQEALGHATLEMAAKYSHVEKRVKSKVTEVIKIQIE